MSEVSRKTGPFRFHYAWLIFLGCCCMMAGGLGAVLNTSGVFFVSVCDDLGFSRGELALYLSFYLVSMVIATPVVGHLLPRANLRVLMTCMFTLVCVAEGLMSTYSHLWQWYASGIVFGLCGSFIFILPTPLMIGNWFKKRTGLILGIAMSFSGIGTAIFSQLFTFFISTWGWRSAYLYVSFIMAVLVLPWTILVFRYRPADMGLLPYGAEEGDVAALPAETEKAADSKDDKQSKGGLFKKGGKDKEAELRASLPGVPVRAAVMSVPFICIFILSGCEEYFGGITNQIPAFANSIGESLAFGATLLSVISMGNIVIKIGVGYLVDKIGVIKTVYVQMTICLIACLVFATTTYQWGLYIAAFFLGVQNSVVTVSEPLLVRYFFGERSYAQVYSYIRVAAGLLGSVGIPIVAFIYDVTSAYTLAFIIGAGLSVFLAGLTFIGERTKHRLKWED
jgi:MFS family permease